MDIYVPAHQLEIRYKKLINFSRILDEKISPFSKTANEIAIENDGARNVFCNLTYDDSFVSVRWDRLLIRYEGMLGELQNLSKAGSIIEHPFFRIFETLKQDPGFGEVLSSITFTLAINADSARKFETERDSFIEKTFNTKNVSHFLKNINDTSVTFEEKTGTKTTTTITGPYNGWEDLRRRNIEVKSSRIKNDLVNAAGQMADIRVLHTNSEVSFAKYKESVLETNNIIKYLWS